MSEVVNLFWICPLCGEKYKTWGDNSEGNHGLSYHMYVVHEKELRSFKP